MTKRLTKIIGLLVFLLAVLYFAFYHYLTASVATHQPEIKIKKGMTVRAISEQLAKQGIIKHPSLFMFYVEITGAGKKMQAGKYRFGDQNTPLSVLKQIREGKVVPLQVRMTEGWTLKQFAETLKENEEIENPEAYAEEWLQSATNPNVAAEYGFPSKTLEGYLLPDTYYLSPGATPKEMIDVFVEAFKKFYAEKIGPLAAKWKLSQHQIVTLASIIEKETAQEEERPLIASVFHNRLKKKMLLQSDPTIIYGLKNFDGNIRYKDLRNPHPYNTYVHAGLPPGPICNPSSAALKATVQPARTDYLFFVSKNNGTHFFSKTNKEHSQAVREYQLKKH